MSNLTETLELPAPLTGCQPGAWISYGKRKLTFQVNEPGRFARNDYASLYVEVIEREPFKGEPLYVTAQRTEARNGYVRRSLTDAAHKALSAALLPAVARYGFSRAWQDAYAHRMAKEPGGAVWEQQRLQAEARWWSQFAELADMMALGLVELVPVERDFTQRTPSVTVLPVYGHRPPSHEAIYAEAHVGGEVVGYLTIEGHLVPPDAELRSSELRPR